jgi:hypothetical protein
MALSRVQRGRPSVRVMVGVVVVVFGVLAAGSFLAERGNDSGGTSARSLARAVVAYDDAIFPGAQLAGQAIVAGIRPDINDFEQGRISVAVWDNDMRARQREFASARSTFERARAPKQLEDATRWFERAFDDYQRAVRLLLAAGPAQGAQRESLISSGASAGEAGDRAFDHGTARIQAVRRGLGLGPDTRFSDVVAK